MKILYAIQGTGNGHISRAREIIPILKKKGEVDILISGIQSDINIQFPVKYKLKGMSFIFGKKGGIDYVSTYLKMDLSELLKDIEKIPIENYDLIFNDFEPVTAWACKQKNIPCIGLSNQAAVLSKNAPQPKKKDRLGRLVLKYYAPTTKKYGFHFLKYDKNIYTPIIRSEIRNLKPLNKRHYTVYLPAYSDEKLITFFNNFKNVHWEIFSKHNKKGYTHNNLSIQPINNESFMQSMANCNGIICGAGFATPSEALFLKKKLLVIPMKGQYEQQCNAEALKKMGVPVIKNLKKKNIPEVKDWIEYGKTIKVDYPDETENIIDKIIEDYYANKIFKNLDKKQQNLKIA